MQKIVSCARRTSLNVFEVTKCATVNCSSDDFVLELCNKTLLEFCELIEGHSDCPTGEDEICSGQCGISEKNYSLAKSKTYSHRIVGGEESVSHAWPWQVLLNIKGDKENHTCGGSIVRNNSA